MATILKIKTLTGRDEVSFQKIPSGDVEVYRVHPGTHEERSLIYANKLSPGETGQPFDELIAVIPKDRLEEVAMFLDPQLERKFGYRHERYNRTL